MLPGIRPTVLGTLSIELVVVVCAVRVEMVCGPGRCAAAGRPPSLVRAGHAERSYLDQSPRRGLEFRGMTWGCRGVPACGMRAWALKGSEFTGLLKGFEGL